MPQHGDPISRAARRRPVLSRRHFVEVTVGLSVTLLGGLVAACTPSPPAAPSSAKDPAKPAPTEATKPAAPAAHTQPTAPKPAETAKPAEAARPVAPAQAGQVTIRIQDWHFTEKTWGAFEREMIEDFKKANPNIAVEPDAVPYVESATKFVAQAKVGQAADVVYGADAHAAQFLDAGYLLDLQPHIANDEQARAANFDDVAMGIVTRGDKVFALPNSVASLLLIYNTEMYEKAGLDPAKPPTTWDELQDAAIKLTTRDASGRTVQWGYAPEGKSVIGSMYRLIGWFWGNDADILTKDNAAAAINSPEAVEAFTFFVELGTRHKVFPPQATELEPTTSRSLMAQGQVAMIQAYLGSRGAIFGENPAMKEKIAFAPVVMKKMRVNPLNSEFFMISSQSKHPEAAAKLVKHLTSKDVLVKMWQANGSIPGRKDAARDPSVDADKFAKVAVAELANSRPVPLIPQWPQIVDATLVGFQKALLGQAEPKQVLDEVAKQIDGFLRRG